MRRIHPKAEAPPSEISEAAAAGEGAEAAARTAADAVQAAPAHHARRGSPGVSSLRPLAGVLRDSPPGRWPVLGPDGGEPSSESHRARPQGGRLPHDAEVPRASPRMGAAPRRLRWMEFGAPPTLGAGPTCVDVAGRKARGLHAGDARQIQPVT